jgi:hypothetical protein
VTKVKARNEISIPTLKLAAQYALDHIARTDHERWVATKALEACEALKISNSGPLYPDVPNVSESEDPYGLRKFNNPLTEYLSSLHYLVRECVLENDGKLSGKSERGNYPEFFVAANLAVREMERCRTHLEPRFLSVLRYTKEYLKPYVERGQTDLSK